MRCYRSATHIIVVTNSFKEKLILRGINENKISVIQNGVNNSFYNPLPKNQDLLEMLNLKEKTVVGYIGTLGMAHNLSFILKSALKTNSNIHFLFIGAGAEKNNLIIEKEKLGLKNVTILDPVQKENVKQYLSILDIALINLKKSDLFKTVIPSKIFENAAMEIPVLIGVDGEARSIIEEYGAGIFFEPGDEQDFLKKLNILTSEIDFYKKCKNGCKQLAISYDRSHLALKMFRKINEILNK
jgi:glycosyltransferase involved in cell wall biosynthesis